MFEPLRPLWQPNFGTKENKWQKKCTSSLCYDRTNFLYSPSCAPHQKKKFLPQSFNSMTFLACHPRFFFIAMSRCPNKGFFALQKIFRLWRRPSKITLSRKTYCAIARQKNPIDPPLPIHEYQNFTSNYCT